MAFIPISFFIGGLICFVREKSKITRAKLAKDLVADYNYMCKIENGTKNLSMEKLNTIIILLKHTPETFMAMVPEYLASLQNATNRNAAYHSKPNAGKAMHTKSPKN